MKKLLMIGAILMMGALSYGGQEAELDATGAADTTLTLRTKGSVVDTTNKTLLVITPMNGTGGAGDKLMFSFGSIAPGETMTLKGKFKAEVLSFDGSGNIKYGILTDTGTPNIKVGLAEKTTTTDPDITGTSATISKVVNKRGTTTKLGDISYTLSTASGVKNGGRTYEGEIISTLKAHETNTGEFTDTGAMVVVNVTGVGIEN